MSMMPQTGLVTTPPPAQPLVRSDLPGMEGLGTEIRRILEAQFTPDQIRRDVKRHTDGWEMTYVEAHDVIARLNTAFNSAWDFTIVNIIPTQFQILIHGRLSVNYWMLGSGGRERATVVKEQFGSCFFKMRGQQMVDVGADYKAAATDAMKKCATQLGIALQLYSRDESAPQGMHRTGEQPHQGTYPAVQANLNDPAMPFQIEALKKMFAKLGVGDPQWWQQLNFTSADQIKQGHVTALMAGDHPWVQSLMQQAGMTPGPKATAA